MEVFNSKPENLVRPLTVADVHLGAQDGRVDVNDSSKFSYYVEIEKLQDAYSKITLIPMATSRFTPTYYQTNEWWDAHKAEIDLAKKEGRPAPRQNIDEVSAWLKEMKLTTNPDVLIIEPALKKTRRIPLQEFLFDHYKRHYLKDGYITVYRGAEKAGEIDNWKRGETPRGVRYWTPTANYAWRYARKNRQFLDEMLADKTPLFKFKIPEQVFRKMVLTQWQQLTLGTELTKHAHDTFDASGVFKDHLNQEQVYLGEGRFGVELELRVNRSGAQEMAKYYQGPVTMDDLVQDRVRVLKNAMIRLTLKNPEMRFEIEAKFNARIEKVKSEGLLLTALKNNAPAEELQKIMRESSTMPAEITNIDGLNLSSWVNEKITKMCSAVFK